MTEDGTPRRKPGFHELPLSIRKEQSYSIRQKKSSSVPVIVELHPHHGELSVLPKHKYLVEASATVVRLRNAIRSDAGLGPDEPLFLYLAWTSDELRDSEVISEVDKAHIDEDGFLYVHVSSLTPRTIKRAVSNTTDTSCLAPLLRTPSLRALLKCINPEREATASLESDDVLQDGDRPLTETSRALTPAGPTGLSDPNGSGGSKAAHNRGLIESLHTISEKEVMASTPAPKQQEAVAKLPSTSSAARVDPQGSTLVSPHGDRFGSDVSIASCTFLNRQASAGAVELQPSQGGKMPPVLLLISFLDMIAAGLVVPMLASYSRHVGGSPRFTGLLQATYGLTQLIGTNAIGGLSDYYGRRRILRLSSVGGMCGYGLLVAALGDGGSTWLLLASRVPIGLLKQSQTVARATAVDCTWPSSRMRAMGRLNATIATGFVLGPAIGPLLAAKISLRTPAMVAMAMFGLQLLFSFLLPETAPLPQTRAELASLSHYVRRTWASVARESAQSAPANYVSVRATSSPMEGVLSMQQAFGLCRDVVSKWRPNSQQLTEEATDLAVKEWGAHLQDSSTGTNHVTLQQFEQTMREVYVQHKESGGMLPAGSAPHLLKSHRVLSVVRRLVHTRDFVEGMLTSNISPTPLAGGPQLGLSPKDMPSASVMTKPSTNWLHSLAEGRKALLAAATKGEVRQLLVSRALVEMSIILMHSVFADYTRAKFDWKQRDVGMGMSFAGALSVVTDLMLIPIVMRRKTIHEVNVALLGVVLIVTGLSLMVFSLKREQFLIGLGCASFGASFFRAAANTLLFNRTMRDLPGVLSGAVDAVEAVCRVVSPIVGGQLLMSGSAEAPLVFGVLLCISGGLVMDAKVSKTEKVKRA